MSEKTYLFDPSTDTRFLKIKDAAKRHVYCEDFKLNAAKSSTIIMPSALLIFLLLLWLKVEAFTYFFAFFAAYFLFLFFTVVALEEWVMRCHLSADELAFFYAYSAYENLDVYFGRYSSGNPERKKESRRTASKSVKRLLLILDQNWNVGDFTLGQNMLGKALSTFKKDFSERLVPNVELGDEGTFLKTAKDIIYQFVMFLQHPSLEQLEHVSGRIHSELGEIREEKENYLTKSTEFLRKHVLIRSATYSSGITIVASFVYFLGTTYFSLTPQEGFITAVTLWGVLIAGYLFKSAR